MIARLGEDVTVGNTTGKALVDRQSADVGEEGGAGAISGTEIMLTVHDGSFPELRAGAELILGGVTYIVLAQGPIEDGDVFKVRCGLKP